MAIRGHLSTNKNAKCYHHCSFMLHATFTFSIKCKWLTQFNSIRCDSTEHINRWAPHKKVISRSHRFPFQFLYFRVAASKWRVSKQKFKRIHKSRRVKSCSEFCHSMTCNNVCLSLGFRWLLFYYWALNPTQHLMLCPTGFECKCLYTMYAYICACVPYALEYMDGLFYYHTRPSAHHSIPSWMKGINESLKHICTD